MTVGDFENAQLLLAWYLYKTFNWLLQEHHESFSDINQNSQQKTNSTATVSNWLISPTNSSKGERKKSATMLEIEKNHSLFVEQQGK